MLTRVAQIAASFLVAWTYAEKQGLGDEFMDGLKTLARLPLDLLGVAATPGGGG
jgi:hypothetical protein